LFVSISQVIGCEDHLQNDLDCGGWAAKLYFKSLLSFLLLTTENSWHNCSSEL